MRFDRITEEVREHADIKNVILNERLSTLQSQMEQKVYQILEENRGLMTLSRSNNFQSLYRDQMSILTY